MTSSTLLLISLFAPMAAAVLSLLIPDKQSPMFRRLALCAVVVSLLSSAALFVGVGAGAAALNVDWLPGLGARFNIGLDSVSNVFLVLAGLVGLTSLAAGGEVIRRAKEYYILVQVLLSGAMLALVAQDLLLFYVACEIDVLCSFVLIACWGDLKGAAGLKTPTHAAMLLTLFLAAGSILMLGAFWYLYHTGGHTFDLQALHDHFAIEPLSPLVQGRLFLVLLLGFGVLLAAWPFHVWAPLGYAAAPTGVSVIGGGLLKTLGAYGLMRVAVPLLPEGAHQYAGVMAGFATAGILYGGWLALRQTDWKMLLGYGSVSHMGYVLLGIATLNTTGAAGVVLILFAHGLAVAAAFALLGHVEAETGTRRIDALGGMVRQMPFVGITAVMVLFAICGLPGFASFWGEVMVFVGAWHEGTTPFRIATIAAVWGLVLTATYVLGAIRTTFFGSSREGSGVASDTKSPLFRVVCALVVAVLIVVGVCPRIITDRIQDSVRAYGFLAGEVATR
jgi:NADH-quinone oxidoreductase subunit M